MDWTLFLVSTGCLMLLGLVNWLFLCQRRRKRLAKNISTALDLGPHAE